ncbi:MAG: hypothetical protein IH946_04165 [Bacteroidetes bacterium]|nr:hypothetical protein [Bacteroidota bacterium]
MNETKHEITCVINNDHSDLQAANSGYSQNGYVLNMVCGYGSNDHLFAALWKKNSENDRIYRTGLTESELGMSIASLKEEGWFIVSLNGYTLKDAHFFNATWSRNNNKENEVIYGLSKDDLNNFYGQMNRKGLSPLDICCYGSKSVPQFAGIWGESHGEDSVCHVDLSGVDLQEYNKDLTARGFQMDNLNGSCYNEMPKYSAIWNKKDDFELNFDIALSADDFINSKMEMRKRQYYPTSVSGFTARSKNYFAVVWQKY